MYTAAGKVSLADGLSISVSDEAHAFDNEELHTNLIEKGLLHKQLSSQARIPVYPTTVCLAGLSICSHRPFPKGIALTLSVNTM